MKRRAAETAAATEAGGDGAGGIGFNRDDGNACKHDKHGVFMAQAEQVFFNVPLLLREEDADSQQPPCPIKVWRQEKPHSH